MPNKNNRDHSSSNYKVTKTISKEKHEEERRGCTIERNIDRKRSPSTPVLTVRSIIQRPKQEKKEEVCPIDVPLTAPPTKSSDFKKERERRNAEEEPEDREYREDEEIDVGVEENTIADLTLEDKPENNDVQMEDGEVEKTSGDKEEKSPRVEKSSIEERNSRNDRHQRDDRRPRDNRRKFSYSRGFGPRSKYNGHSIMRDPEMREKAMKERELRERYGTTRFYGIYKCKGCGNQWNSGDTWENMPQQCRKCKSRVFADPDNLLKIRIDLQNADIPSVPKSY